MTSPTWRALGQVVLVYFAVGVAAITAQDTQPGRGWQGTEASLAKAIISAKVARPGFVSCAVTAAPPTAK